MGKRGKQKRMKKKPPRLKHVEKRSEKEAKIRAKSGSRIKMVASVALGLALCAGGAAAVLNHMERESGRQFSGRAPVSEPIRNKKSISFQFMEHRGIKQPYCGFRKALRESRPDILFLESAAFTPQDAAAFAADINGRDVSKALVYLPDLFRRQVLDTRRQSEEEGRQIRILIAESYSKTEIQTAVRHYENNLKQSREAMLRVMMDEDVDGAIEIILDKCRSIASFYRLRNDRIFQTISETTEEEDLSVLLMVGSDHSNLIKMFSDAGFDTSQYNLFAGRRLATIFEAVERGWERHPSNERDLAAREIALLFLYSAYGKRGFGYSEEWSAVSEVSLPEFTENALREIATKVRRETSAPAAIRELGFDVPVSHEEFKVVSKRLGYDKCLDE